MTKIKNFLRSIFPDQSPFRLAYHKMLAVFAAVYYRFPAEQLEVVAITGTNGKTTTAHMVAAIFAEAGKKVGMATTVAFRIGDQYWPNTSKMTTQSPFALQKLLRRMVDQFVDVAIIEATSHALIQSRLWGVNVDTAVLTNIDKDHLEYHGSFDEYQRAKGLLFERMNREKRKPQVQKIAVLNRDDGSYEYMSRFFYDLMITYGFKEKAMVTARDLKFAHNHVIFTLKVPNDAIEIRLPVSGKFNIENALAAISVGIGHQIKLEVIRTALEKMSQVPGRLEAIDEGQLFNIVVDYAHTPDAFQKIFETYRPITKGKMIVVFGATGGGRDKAKRPEMGRIADRFCDYIVLTNDDPYFEEQMAIVNQIAEGISRKEGDRFWKVIDRRQAIKLALMMAKDNDTVLVLGKGGEEVIAIEGKLIEWDDRKVIRELLSREIRVEIDGEEEQRKK